MRAPFLAAFLALASLTLNAAAGTTPALSEKINFQHLPWADGEALTYLVSWNGLDAAQGTFTARNTGKHEADEMNGDHNPANEPEVLLGGSITTRNGKEGASEGSDSQHIWNFRPIHMSPRRPTAENPL